MRIHLMDMIQRATRYCWQYRVCPGAEQVEFRSWRQPEGDKAEHWRGLFFCPYACSRTEHHHATCMSQQQRVENSQVIETVNTRINGNYAETQVTSCPWEWDVRTCHRYISYQATETYHRRDLTKQCAGVWTGLLTVAAQINKHNFADHVKASASWRSELWTQPLFPHFHCHVRSFIRAPIQPHSHHPFSDY